MLRYSEVATDLIFVDVATTPLELRPTVKISIRNYIDGSPEDGAETGNECKNE